MGPGRDRTRDPWICSQTRICCQTPYRLRYAARWFLACFVGNPEDRFSRDEVHIGDCARKSKKEAGRKRRDEHREGEGNEKNDEGAGCIDMGKIIHTLYSSDSDSVPDSYPTPGIKTGGQLVNT